MVKVQRPDAREDIKQDLGAAGAVRREGRATARRSARWSTWARCSSTCRRRCSASSTSGRRPANIERMRGVLEAVHRAGRARRLRRPVDLAAAGDGGDPGGRRSARRPRARRARRPRASCSSRYYRQILHRRVLPRRPAPREPDVVERPHLLPGLRHGRRGRRRDARAADAAADGVLAGGRRLPHRRDADAGRRRSTAATSTSTRSSERDRRADGASYRDVVAGARSSSARSCRR